MEDHGVQDGYFAWRDIMAYKAHRIGKRARRQNLSLSEYAPSSVNMNVHTDMDDSQCSETESTLSVGSSSSDSRSTNTSFGLSAGCEYDDDEIYFPSYNDEDSRHKIVDPEVPTVPRLESPELIERAEDDTAIRVEPSRHVDYLSHDWRVDDILPSWRHVVSNRKSYNNSTRLANAAWRTWEKKRSNLKTVSADSLNWLKDCDVTWLYGPLQIGSYKSLGEIALTGGVQSRPPRPNSPVPKKTSLKKRSMSEMMLQRSLSSSSLLKQAAAAVQAQRSVRTSGSWKAIAPHMGESPRLLTSLSSPELTSPCVERNTRNVRFHEQVEQCIAVDLASNYSDDDDLEEPQPAKYNYFSDSNYDSDEGLIMMVKSKYIRGPRPVVEPKLQFTPSMRYLIETLPCTLLKSRDEDPRPPTQSIRRSGKLSSYPSQETHQPINPSARIVLEVNAEDEEEFDWFSPSTFSSKFSCKLESDNQRADPLPNNSVPPSLELSRKLKSDIEMKAPKDEKTCSKCSLQTIPSWRNCDMCPECIRTLVLDDSEYDDPTLTSFSRAATTWERAPTTEDSSQDIALVASSWTEESASTTLDDFSPNGSDLVSFALPLRFARSVGLPYTDPGNSLAELGESGPKNEIASEGPEECEAEGESRFQASSEYYSSEPDNTGSDNGAYHGLCDISNGQSETDLAPILGPMKQALVNRIMEEFWAIFNQGPDSRYIGCAGNTPESSAPSSAISSPNSSSVKPSQRKRRRDDDDERPPDDNNDRKPRQPRSGQPSTLDPEENKRFACPFRKHDSRKYSVYNHRACALSHWETISRVKEHIYRCHQKAIHCKRCWRVFKNQQQLDSHITVAAADICEVKPGHPPDGIIPEIERKLRSRKKSHPNQTEEDRWREMYQLLFPNEQLPSPYFESPQQEGRLSPDSRNLANYEDYIRRELPRLVRSNIEEVVRREMQPFEASLVGNLVNIIQDCQDRVFRSYREHEMSSNEDLDLSDNAAATPHPQTDDLGQMNRPGDEAEPTSDFLNSIFQPTPAATGLPERYVADPHLFNLFEDPNHLVPSDSGYGSEQLCNCPGLCSCSASGSSGQMRDARNGQARQDGNISWEEQDWCLYPAWNQNDLMDAELHWEGGD